MPTLYTKIYGYEAVRPARASLNPLCFALCWNSHRLSKHSNSGSIRPSIGGIETELVMSRGQEILTRALCRLPAGECTHTHAHTLTAKLTIRQIFENTCIQIHEHKISASLPTRTETRASLGHKLPLHQHNTAHLTRADSGPVCSSQSSLPAVCLKVRASSQLQQLNIKLPAATSPRAQLTQSIALHYSWGRRGPMRWPLTEGWISTVPNFTRAGGRVTPSTTAYRQRK